ncbi:MAG: hypothetical protein ABEJ89_03295 [Haloarculaceae archaeon]
MRFGIHQENQTFAHWRYENGVHGLLSSGVEGDSSPMVPTPMVVVGSDGELRIGQADGPMLECRRDGKSEAIDVDSETMHTAGEDDDDGFGSQFHDRAVADPVDGLETGARPQTAGRIGLHTVEILFGGYESVRRPGRVDFPLELDDNPFEALIDAGHLPRDPADPIE